MTVNYTVLDPTGNITLIADSGIPVCEQAHTASELLKAEPMAEQAGFIMPDTDCDISLRMGGGEFCGNATLSAAALYCKRAGSEGQIKVRMSGCSSVLRVDMQKTSENNYRGTLTMPSPVSIRRVTLPHGQSNISLDLVDFGGIAHLVDTEDRFRGEVSAELMRRWCAALGSEALGIMRFEPVFSRMEPVVYVRDIDTLYYERSCASGTSALGAVLARKKGTEISVPVSEPGGVLTIFAHPNGVLRLTGNVHVAMSKTITL